MSAILRINPPKDVSGVRSLLGVVNFIKNHIPRRAEICEPITRLTRKDVKFVWGEEQQKAFEKLKAVVSEAILLTYPNPNRPFDLYPDASQKYAMGAVLAQDGKIVSTFSRKFNEAQLKYTVTGQELLAAVEACKHFDQIIDYSGVRNQDPLGSQKSHARRHGPREFERAASQNIFGLGICADFRQHRRRGQHGGGRSEPTRHGRRRTDEDRG